METFEGESANADDVVAACNTLPFASERRLVVVRGVDKMPKDGVDVVVDYVSDPSPTTILALTAKKVAKNTRLYKAVDKIGGLLEREGPKAYEWPKAVQDLFARKDKQVSADGAELLVNSVGKDLRRLSVEVDKVVAFTGSKVRLTREDIAEVVSTTAAPTVFELNTALANRNCGGALRLVERLLGAGESVFGLHALAVRQVRDLITARALIERGDGSAFALGKALGRPDWQIKNVPRQAEAFSSEQLVDILRAAASSEAEMKTSRDARLVFERWIVKVCG